MIAEVKKWGNSLAIRLTGEELRGYGLREGDRVRITLEKVAPMGEVDLSSIPTFHDEDRKASEHHDKYLYRRG